jgi:alanine dehydrogenase
MAGVLQNLPPALVQEEVRIQLNGRSLKELLKHGCCLLVEAVAGGMETVEEEQAGM